MLRLDRNPRRLGLLASQVALFAGETLDAARSHALEKLLDTLEELAAGRLQRIEQHYKLAGMRCLAAGKTGNAVIEAEAAAGHGSGENLDHERDRRALVSAEWKEGPAVKHIRGFDRRRAVAIDRNTGCEFPILLLRQQQIAMRDRARRLIPHDRRMAVPGAGKGHGIGAEYLFLAAPDNLVAARIDRTQGDQLCFREGLY